VTNPETDAGSNLSDGDLLGFDADGPVDVLDDSQWENVQKEEDSRETTGEEEQKQPAEEQTETEPAAEDEDQEKETASEEDATPGDIAADQGEETTGGFTWLGKEYDSKEAAEHAQKSYDGTINSWQSKYNQSQQENQDLKAQIEGYTRQVSPKEEPTEAEGEPAPPTDEKALKKVSDVINSETVKAIADDPNYGFGHAVQYMLEKFDEVQEHNMAVVNDERLSVIEADREEVRMFNETCEIFSALAARTEDGTPYNPENPEAGGKLLYPELATDEAFVSRVTDRWLKTSGLREEGEYGVYLAYLAEKEWMKYQNNPTVEPKGKPQVAKPSEIVNKATTTTPALAVETQALSSGPGPSPSEGGPETEESRIRRELLEAPSMVDDVLGYEA
jgi:hypothetical protein